jgi:hypothetical protein
MLPLPGDPQADRLPSRQGEELLEIHCRQARPYHQNLSCPHGLQDGGEIPQRVIAQPRIDRGVDGQAVPADEQGQPIRPGPGDQFEGDIPSGSGVVFHNHRLAKHRCKMAGDQPRQRVEAASRRYRDDQPDGAVGPPARGGGRAGLRPGGGGSGCEAGQEGPATHRLTQIRER